MKISYIFKICESLKFLPIRSNTEDVITDLMKDKM